MILLSYFGFNNHDDHDVYNSGRRKWENHRHSQEKEDTEMVQKEDNNHKSRVLEASIRGIWNIGRTIFITSTI